MTEDFNKKVCEKAGLDSAYAGWEKDTNVAIHILIKAMWAINREGKWEILMDKYRVYCMNNTSIVKIFMYNQNNYSEQEALTKALDYIFTQEAK